VMGLIGDVKDQNAVIIDDIIDTGGTIIKAAETLKQYGAKKIVIAATHGIFSKGFDIFENNPAVEKVIITDSIDNDELLDK
ncbi:ribose-phosphate pyrophosphokinase, partial [Xanthomonas citri pv. citri]|nr:ribose-phosphate pyrophosphokinase [Xanthomonas citri pv. citri]